MTQQQIKNYHQPAPQTLVNQQWNSPYTFHQHFYAGGQGPVALNFAQNGDPWRPQWPVPDALVPGFSQMGHGVQQQPLFGGTNVQSHTAHVCGSGKGLFTEQEQQILRALCSSVVERSEHTRDCNSVGAQATRDSVNLFLENEEEAKKYFWRRGQKNSSQRKGRAEKKQQKYQAQQPDPRQQWSANTSVYLQQMQMVDDNAEGPVGVHMQQEAQQMPLPHDLDLDMLVDPQLVLLPPVDPQFGLPANTLPIQQNL